MIRLHVCNQLLNPGVPELGVLSMVLSLRGQAVALQIAEVCKGWENVKRISSYDNHLLSRERFASWDVLRVVGLRDPDLV